MRPYYTALGDITGVITGDFEGDSGSGGDGGLVPAPPAGSAAMGAFLKADGTWAVPSGGGSEYTAQVILDFGFQAGEEGDIAEATIAASWVTATSDVTCTVLGATTIDHDPDDAVVESLCACVTNIMPGVSFDVTLCAPQNTWGKYLVNIRGVE